MPIDIETTLTDLPGDPQAALVEIFDRLSESVVAEDYGVAIMVLRSWCDKNNIQAVNKSSNYESEWNHWKARAGKVRHAFMKILVEEKVNAAVEGELLAFGYARLDPTEKREVHEKLIHIREIVEDSSLEDRKKNAILKKLNALAAEVDKTGTSTDHWFGFIIDLGLVSKEFHQNAKPLIDDAKEMARIVLRSRARNENVELPPPGDFPLLD